jgi:hypothetical protein
MTAAFRKGAAAPAGPAQAVWALLASVLSLLRMILSDASVEKRRKESDNRSPAAGGQVFRRQHLRSPSRTLVGINAAVAGALRRH